jgi:hypothetical protein
VDFYEEEVRTHPKWSHDVDLTGSSTAQMPLWQRLVKKFIFRVPDRCEAPQVPPSKLAAVPQVISSSLELEMDASREGGVEGSNKGDAPQPPQAQVEEGGSANEAESTSVSGQGGQEGGAVIKKPRTESNKAVLATKTSKKSKGGEAGADHRKGVGGAKRRTQGEG